MPDSLEKVVVMESVEDSTVHHRAQEPAPEDNSRFEYEAKQTWRQILLCLRKIDVNRDD
jgi:hypothetical protein